VTHPFHPLFGREFELVEERVGGNGEQRVQFRDDRSHVQSLPSAWTDVAEQDPVVQLAAGRAWLRAEDLLRLAELIRRVQG
jgi:hypothetical protein